tara:strand:- start:486 stop:869 length:384 start_codon:yes stop_codon:yes gene_type:complete
MQARRQPLLTLGPLLSVWTFGFHRIPDNVFYGHQKSGYRISFLVAFRVTLYQSIRAPSGQFSIQPAPWTFTLGLSIDCPALEAGMGTEFHGLPYKSNSGLTAKTGERSNASLKTQPDKPWQYIHEHG